MNKTDIISIGVGNNSPDKTGCYCKLGTLIECKLNRVQQLKHHYTISHRYGYGSKTGLSNRPNIYYINIYIIFILVHHVSYLL